MPAVEESIKISLGKEEKSFRDFDELDAWIEQEVAIWNGFAASLTRADISTAARDAQKNTVNSFKTQVTQIKGTSDNADRQSRVANLVNDIVNKCGLKKLRYISSCSPQGQHVLGLAEDGEKIELAVAVLSYFVATDLQPNDLSSIMVSGLLEGAMFDKGTTKSVESERRALSKLRKEWNVKFDEDDTKNANTLAAAEDVKRKLGKYRADEAVAFSTAMQVSKDRLAELEDLFFSKIQVDASNSYWAERGKNARVSFALWVVLMAVVAGAFATTFISMTDKAIQAGVVGEAALLAYGSLLVFAVVGVGGLRLIAKMLVSALHVNHEAGERVTMIKTYLALLAEESAVTEDERNLILPTLFRPGSTGLLGEEPKAEMPIEMVLRVLAKRSTT